MYWYISFLRPPPTRATTQLEFIPQLSNDLRTELYPDTIDIYYFWTSVDFKPITELPTKLTTWRPENAHKIISVTCPTSHQQVRLGLLTVSAEKPRAQAPQTTSSSCIVLSDHCMLACVLPLPVYSAPISIVPGLENHMRNQGRNSKNKPVQANIKKQDEICRIFTSPVYSTGVLSAEDGAGPPGDRRVIITEKTGFDLDKKIWDSGLGLTEWLSQQIHSIINDPQRLDRAPRSCENAMCGSSNSIDCTAKALIEDLFRTLLLRNPRIVELGSGSGIVSVFLATFLAHWRSTRDRISGAGSVDVNPYDWDIIATDLSTAIPLIRRNGEANYRDPMGLHAVVLDWEDPNLPEEVISSPPNIILMSDVTYNTDSFPALLQTIVRLMKLSPHVKIVLAYKERHPAERKAWDMFKDEAGLSFHKVQEIVGSGPPPVEIWLGSAAIETPVISI